MAPSTTVGVFADRSSAERAVEALHRASFRSDQIGMITRNDTTRPAGSHAASDDVAADEAGTGAATGAVAGAGIGALVGWGVLTGMIPVIGPAIAAGTLGVILSNAVGGAAVAGIAGALAGWGVSDEHAKYYEGEVTAGRTVVTVTAEGRVSEARSILRQFGATSRDPDFA